MPTTPSPARESAYGRRAMTNVWGLTERLYVDLRLQASGVCPA